MKFLTIYTLIAIALISDSGLAANANLTSLLPAPIMVKNVDLRTWPESVSLPNALEIFKAMGEADPATTQVFNRAKQKLAEHGITDIQAISSYCPNDASLGDAYFSQQTKMIDTRIVVAGTVLKDWSTESIEVSKKSFSSKVIRTPFIDYLLVALQPTICIKKSDNLLFSYNAIVHELFHFLAKDPFEEFEDGITSSGKPNFLDMMVSQTGGEFEAYTAGLSAEIKFFVRNNIGITKDQYRFFDQTGALTDAKGFKDSITKLYTPYYNDPTTLATYMKGRLDIVQWQLQVLDVNVRPAVFAISDKELQKKFLDEFARVKSQSELLKK